MKTEWRKVPSFPCYVISNEGTVCRTKNGKIMALSTNQKGFSSVTLSAQGKPGTRNVHRLMLEAFGVQVAPKEVAVFFDGDQANLRLDNLRVITAKANSARITALKRAVSYPTAKFFTLVELEGQAALSEFYNAEEDAAECHDEEIAEFPPGAKLTLWPVYDLTQTRGAEIKSLTSILKKRKLKNDFTL